jgi:hypothetical protein
VRKLRRPLIATPWIAWCVIALALLVRVAVPGGLMPANVGGILRLQICSGSLHQTVAVDIGLHRKASGDPYSGDPPCPFSALSSPSLGGADPVLLALAVAFVFASALFFVLDLRPLAPVGLRPPARAPPGSRVSPA